MMTTVMQILFAALVIAVMIGLRVLLIELKSRRAAANPAEDVDCNVGCGGCLQKPVSDNPETKFTPPI